jgi:hypothetical protein
MLCCLSEKPLMLCCLSVKPLMPCCPSEKPLMLCCLSVKPLMLCCPSEKPLMLCCPSEKPLMLLRSRCLFRAGTALYRKYDKTFLNWLDYSLPSKKNVKAKTYSQKLFSPARKRLFLHIYSTIYTHKVY